MLAKNLKLIRIKEVIEISGLKRSTLFVYINQGTFPSQIKLGKRCSAWIENEVLEVNFARIAEKTEQEIKELVANQKELRLQNTFH
ncbi:helix-turn-helix transcriptional regulator [Nitrosomonas ureae]|uniref:Transcriptional regulator, AlpA family n=1 Tax=Nitrosomonas ureae TaxID=44577 RepID=A0A286A6Y4_9PROT|nr:AlpA family phage regulatory protein [Nitrosomonas ureae]SOD17694.1 transcriptional regulator, AlpA family [Nitrosomonas ureae]